MNSIERVLRTIQGREADRVPRGIFGTSPEGETRLARELHCASVVNLYHLLGLDILHIEHPLDYVGEARSYKGLPADPWGVPLDVRKFGNSGDLCPLKDIASVEEAHAFRWPDIRDFSADRFDKMLDDTGAFCVEGGLWAPIFHNLTWLCGFETALINLHEQPDVSHALIGHITDFWVDCCELLLKTARGRVHILQNCNDFGSQRGLLLSRGMFLEFFAPALKRLYDAIHEEDVYVLQHSCGAVGSLYEDCIRMGADILNPVQTSAEGMEIEELSAAFGGRVTLYGGIDTQHVLPEGPVLRVRQVTRRTLEVMRAKRYILGPSQGIESDIPSDHVKAMFGEADAVLDGKSWEDFHI